MAKVIKAAVIAAAAVFITILIVNSGGALAPLFTGGGTIAGLSVAAQYAIVTFVGSVVAGGIGMLTSRGIGASGQNFGTKVAGRGAQVPRQIVYGECRVGGTIVKMHTSGADNSKLHLSVVLAGHEIESLEGVYFNDTKLTTSTSTVSGETVYKATNAKFKNTDNENAIDSAGTLVRYTFHDGSQSTVDGLANSANASRYPSTAKFQGMAYVYMEVVYDPEKMPSFPPLHFRVKGKKVYDPRSSSTAWSRNPALIIRDYLTDTTYGLKALSSEINDTNAGGGFTAAANACDVDMTLADNSSQEDRFTLDGFVNAASAGDAILEGFLSSCGGKITHTNGKFNLFVATAQTPSLTITDDDVLDTQQLSTKSGNGDLYNGIKALFVDKDQNYQGAETPILLNSSYLAEDTPSGEQSANYKKILETQLPFTTSHTMGQRIQKIQLMRQRESAVMSLLTSLKFMKLQPGDWVNVTNSRLSFSSKTFEVLSTQMEFSENEGVLYAATRLTLQETSAGIYNYLYSEYSTPQTAGSTPPGGDLSVRAPTAGTLSQRTRPEGPTAKIDIIVSWTNAAEAGVQGTEIQYKESGESAYDVATLAGRGATTAVITNVQVGKTYDVRIRHFSWDNVYSSFVSFSQTTIVEPDTLLAPGNPAATTDKPFFIELTWTNPTNANFRAVEVHYSTTSGFTPDSNTLLNTYYGEPAKQKKVILGVSAGLAYDTNYYFKLRSVNVYGTTSGYTLQATGQFKKAQNADVENLNASAITAGTIDAGTVTVSNIDAGEISTGTLSSDRVNTGQIVVGGLESGVTITQGSLTMNAGGHIKGGQVEYNDADASGFFLGYDTDAYKFSIGNSDNSKAITFDGSDLTVKGAITATSLTLNADAKASLLTALELEETFYALNTINYGALSNLTFTPDNIHNTGSNVGEVTVHAGSMKAGSTTYTLSSTDTVYTPYEGAIKPPYAGNHFYLIFSATDVWASDNSNRFTTTDATTRNGADRIFVAIYDEVNDQWKAVDNLNNTTNFTPLATDYVIAVGTKTTSTGGLDSVKPLIVYADDPEADQTVNALNAGTTINNGGITLSSGGVIKGGQTAYNDEDASGFFLGYESGAYKFSIGNADNTQRLTFDGSNLGVKGTITVGSTDLTETNALNANTTPSDVGLNVDYALEGVNYNALSNITFVANSSNGTADSNDGETYITAGTLKAGSTTRTIAASTMHSPYEGVTKPPYSGNHFFIISGASDAWASDTSARFQTSNNETLGDNANNNHLFVAIYDDGNDQWKAVDNNGATTNFTPLPTDYVIAVATKTSSSGGYDSLVPLTVYADDPEADQTVNALESTTTITGGGIIMSSGGAIKGGQSAFDTGTGFFLGYDSNAYKFSIGNAGNNSLTFNGSTLSVSGNITANSLTLASTVAIDGDNLPIDIYAGVDSTTLNKDPYFAKRDGTRWTTASGNSISIDADYEFTFKTDGSGLPTGRSTFLQSVSADDASDQFFSEFFPLESDKAYRITVWVQQPSGTKTNYLSMDFRDSSNVRINNASSPVSDATGFGAIGSYHYWLVLNQVFPTTFTKYEIVIGGNSSIQPPSNATSFNVGALTLRSSAGSTTTVNWAQYHVEEIDTAATNASVTSIGGVTITDTKLHQGTGTFNNANTGFYLDSAGQFSLKDKLSFDGSDLTVSGSVTAESFTLSSGASLSDADDQIANTNNNAFFRYETTAANDAVAALSDSEFNTAFGRNPRNRDVLIVVNTGSDPDVSAAYVYDSSLATPAFVAKNDFLTGDLIVDGTIKAANIDVNDLITSGSLLTGSATISNDIRIGSGDSVFSADSDGIYLGSETFSSAEFRVTPAGVMTATGATFTGGAVSNTTTVGGTAASTVASGAAAGATASQVNKGLALVINQTASGSSNAGECGLVGVDKDGAPELNTNGFIIYNGTKYTVDRGQYSTNHTLLTNLANKKGFICIDVNNTKPFDTTSYGNLDIAFVYKVGDQWYYDENSTAEIQFTPSSITGNQTGTDNTTTPKLLAIGYLETGSPDDITAGGLFEPVELESAPFYGDTVNSGTVGGISIDGSKIYAGTGTWGATNTGFYLDSSGDFSLKNKLKFDASEATLTLDGQLNATKITVGSGVDTAAMQATGDVRFWAGSENPSATTPFVVQKDGEVFARNLVLTDTDGNEYFNAAEGFTNLALTEVVSEIEGAKITTYSEALSSDSEEIEIAFEQASNVTFKGKLNANFFGSTSNSSQIQAEANSRAEIPDNFKIMLRYHTSSGFSSSQGTLIASQVYTKVTSGVTPTSVQYALSTTSFEDLELSEFFSVSTVIKNDAGAPNASGFVILTSTVSSFPSGTHYVKAFISTTDSSYSTTNKVTGSASRTIEIQDNTDGGGFTIDGGASQSVGAADITSVAIAANNGITGAATASSGAASFTLGLGDITPTTVTTTGNVVVGGNLTVNGSTTELNTTTLQVQDKNIVLNYADANTSSTADGAGITIQDAVSASTDATMLWESTYDYFKFSHTVGVPLLPADGVAFYTSSDNQDIDLLRVSGVADDQIAKTGSYGFSLKYLGTGSNNNNTLKLLADNQNAASQETAYTVFQDGTMTFGKALTFTSNTFNMPAGGLHLNTNAASSGANVTSLVLSAFWEDISTQSNFIDFRARDGNDNEYPQVRIGAENKDPSGSQIEEGKGSFVVYTNDATGTTLGGTTDLSKRFEVHNEVTTVSGKIVAGEAQTVGGQVMMEGYYSDGSTHVIGSTYSSGGGFLGYGVYPSSASATEFLSSTGIALNRAAYKYDTSHHWYVGSSQTVAFGSAATLTQRMQLTASELIVKDGVNVVSDSGSGGTTNAFVLKSTGYTGNVTKLEQNNAGTRSTLETSERPLYIYSATVGSPSAEIRMHTNGTTGLGFKMDANQDITLYGDVSNSGRFTSSNSTIGSVGAEGTIANAAFLAGTTGSGIGIDSNEIVFFNSGVGYINQDTDNDLRFYLGNQRTGGSGNTQVFTLLANKNARFHNSLDVDGDLDVTGSFSAGSLSATDTFTITSTGATPTLNFNSSSTSDAAVDFAIRANGENLEFIEPEQSNKVHFKIIDDGGVSALEGYKYGSSDTLIISGTGDITAQDISSAGSITADSGAIRGNYILGRNTGHSDQDMLWAISDEDTNESIALKLGQSASVDWVEKASDATAPASGIFTIDGARNMTFGPYIPIDDNTEITFETWAKHVSGTDNEGRLYAGGQFYDGNKTSLGNVSRYWGANGDLQDSDNTGWRHIKGVLKGSAIRGASGTTTAQYVRLLFLFNYQADGNKTVFCGTKFYVSRKTITSLYHKNSDFAGISQDTGFTTGYGNGTGVTEIIDGSGVINTPSYYQVSGTTVIDSNRNAFVAEYVNHDGDTDTNIRFQDNRITINAAGGSNSIDLHNNGTIYHQGPAQFYSDVNLGANTDASRFLIINKATTGTNGIILRNAGNNKVKLLQNASEFFELHTNNQLALTVNESQAAVFESNIQATSGIFENAQGSGVNLTLRNTMADIDGSGATLHGVAMNFEATDGNATFTPQAQIRMYVKDYSGDGGAPSEGMGNLAFLTGAGTDSSGNGTLTEVMRVTEDQKVGIGTQTPSETLTVSGSISGSVLRTSIPDPGNPQATANQVRLSGYGMMGNRGLLYITNADSSGVVQIGVGGSHNQNPALTVSATNINAHGSTLSSGAITSTGTSSFTTIGSGDITSTGDLEAKTGTFTGQNGTALIVNSGTTNVTSQFTSGDAEAWISLKDSSSGTYGLLMGHAGNDANRHFVVADTNAVDRFRINTGGSITMVDDITGTGDFKTTGGFLESGTGSGTGGSFVLKQRYSGTAHHIATMGTMYSSGSWLLGYGVGPKAGAYGYVSTFSNFNGTRNALELFNNGFQILYGPAQTTAVGSDITSLTTPLLFRSDTGALTLKGTAPHLILGNDSESDNYILFQDNQDPTGQNFKITYSSATNLFSMGHDEKTNFFQIAGSEAQQSVELHSTAVDALLITGSNGGIKLTGGNNRIYFGANRALEGNTAGTSLQVGEGYSQTSIQSTNTFIENQLAIGGTASFAARSNFQIHAKHTGTCRLLLEADTDNVTEEDIVQIRMEQDGSQVNARIGFTSNNVYEIINEYPSSMILGVGNSTKLTIDNSGNGTFTGNVTAYSDARLKENITTIDNALGKVAAMRGVFFDRIDAPELGRQTGVVAQEIAECLPEVVMEGEDGTLSVSYGNITGTLIEAVKELKRDNDELRALVNKLMEKMEK